MIRNKKRKEITLDDDTIALLQMQADKEGRKLKNYMEFILHQRAHSYELTDEYKAMMDDMLDKHKKGELNYTSWSEVKKQMLQ